MYEATNVGAACNVARAQIMENVSSAYLPCPAYFFPSPWLTGGLAVLLTASIRPLISYGSLLAASRAARTSPT